MDTFLVLKFLLLLSLTLAVCGKDDEVYKNGLHHTNRHRGHKDHEHKHHGHRHHGHKHHGHKHHGHKHHGHKHQMDKDHDFRHDLNEDHKPLSDDRQRNLKDKVKYDPRLKGIIIGYVGAPAIENAAFQNYSQTVADGEIGILPLPNGTNPIKFPLNTTVLIEGGRGINSDLLVLNSDALQSTEVSPTSSVRSTASNIGSSSIIINALIGTTFSVEDSTSPFEATTSSVEGNVTSIKSSLVKPFEISVLPDSTSTAKVRTTSEVQTTTNVSSTTLAPTTAVVPTTTLVPSTSSVQETSTANPTSYPSTVNPTTSSSNPLDSAPSSSSPSDISSTPRIINTQKPLGVVNGPKHKDITKIIIESQNSTFHVVSNYVLESGRITQNLSMIMLPSENETVSSTQSTTSTLAEVYKFIYPF